MAGSGAAAGRSEPWRSDCAARALQITDLRQTWRSAAIIPSYPAALVLDSSS